MNALGQEVETYREAWIKLGIDCYTEHREGQEDEPYRAYLTSRALGGLLAQTVDGGWVPAYPDKPNYPIKGKWYSPSKREFNPKHWRHAVIAALDPALHNFGSELGERLSRERAAKLRDYFRAQIVIALIKGMSHE